MTGLVMYEPSRVSMTTFILLTLLRRREWKESEAEEEEERKRLKSGAERREVCSCAQPSLNTWKVKFHIPERRSKRRAPRPALGAPPPASSGRRLQGRGDLARREQSAGQMP